MARGGGCEGVGPQCFGRFAGAGEPRGFDATTGTLGMPTASAKALKSSSAFSFRSTPTKAHAAVRRAIDVGDTKNCAAFFPCRLGAFGLSATREVLRGLNALSIDTVSYHAYHAFHAYAYIA